MSTFIVLAKRPNRPDTAYKIPATGFRQIRSSWDDLRTAHPDLFGEIIHIERLAPSFDNPEDQRAALSRIGRVTARRN